MGWGQVSPLGPRPGKGGGTRIAFLCTLLLLVFSFSLTWGQINETECIAPQGRDIYWIGNVSHSWNDGGNWDENALPRPSSSVHLLEDDYSTLAAGTSLQISGLLIGSSHFFKVGPDNKLTVSYLEITCYGVNWCHGRGSCIDIDTCLCDPGYTGPSCKDRTINLIQQPLQDGMTISFVTPSATRN